MSNTNKQDNLSVKRSVERIFNPDPKGILFVPEGMENDNRFILNNDEEKQIYREELKNATLNAIKSFFQAENLTDDEKKVVDVEKFEKVFKEISDARLNKPNTSLFVEIHVRIGILVQNPESFGEDRKNLNQQEVNLLKESLKFARDILLKAARGTGIFGIIDKKVEVILRNPDLEEAILQLHELKDQALGSGGFMQMETEMLNRSSQDFAGISTFYINSKIYQLELAITLAEQKFFENKARETDDKETLLDEADTRKQVVKSLTKLIDDISVNDQKSEFTEMVMKHLLSRENFEAFDDDLEQNYDSKGGKN